MDRLDPHSLQTHFLRLAQERGLLEMIFQSIQEGVLVVNGEGRLDFANRAAEGFLGFGVEAARGRPIVRLLPDVDWDRILGLDESEWSRLFTQEIEITYPVHRILSFYVVPLAVEHQEDRGVLIILRDVTRDRQEEASLLESERLNAVKLLAAGVAHEIGNPLNALNIHLQLLDREIRGLRDRVERAAAPAGPEALLEDLSSLSELTDVTRNEVARLDLIITQFLRAIRPSRPTLALCRVDQLLREALTLLKQEVLNRRIEIAVEFPERTPRLRVDRDQLKQAFFNIIRNAFQAMPDGGTLTITVFTTDESLGLSFRDSGVGIERDAFSRLFEPYHTTKPGGTGLGLMIVQRIVQDHGGRIEVRSKPGAGTTFTILLPLVERRVRLLNAAGPAGDEEEAGAVVPDGEADA